MALPTYGNLADLVRQELQDADKDRYDDTRLIDALNLATLDLRRLRPDYFIGRYAEPVFTAKLLEDEYPYSEMTIPAIVKYAVGWVEMADDEYTNDGRAVGMMGMFKDDLTT